MIDVEHWALLHYTLPLHRPLTAGTDTQREGVILVLRQGNAVGHGEAAPITGFHPFSLPEVVAQLTQALRHGAPPSSPTAQHCIDGALWSLRATAQRVRPAALLAANPAPSAPIQALIDAHDPVAQARRLIDAGCTAAKIKVGRRDPAREAEDILAIARHAPGLRLRLDANRAWDFETACAVADRLQGLRVDYIEEPLADPSRLCDFHDRTGMPFALDESLQERPTALPRGTAALVIKPTVLGGLQPAQAWMQHAQRQGVHAIISATFESGVGLGLLAELACATHPTPPPQGLGTGRWLAGDVCIPPLQPRRFHLRWNAPRLDPGLPCIASSSGK